ncbi:hypothetical protein [Saccharibacillus brassicae]|uniref:ParB/Sulfiredoxin domain-containing protein n=1 Tax=Saccharibacillus brassicae TaxID=2583377 RepID=A0A4Y6V4D7_SACBS|nr:hypothetical protein [Saccharibacillus brassicae]QDH23436.1 hypothetical protein FFV09_22760 [Saccharibacillus brassicae]
MNVISSQRHIDWEIVTSKEESVRGAGEVTLPVVLVGEYNGSPLYVLVDGHHTREAAKEVGVAVVFEEMSRADAGVSYDADLTQALEEKYMGSDYYWITGDRVERDIIDEEWELMK